MSDWLKHVKETMKLHPNKTLKEVLQMAKKTYKKAAATGKKLLLRKGKKQHGGMETQDKQVEPVVDTNAENSLGDEKTNTHVDNSHMSDDNSHMSGGMTHKKGGMMTHKKGGMMTHKKGGMMTHKKGGMMTHKKGGMMTHKKGGMMTHKKGGMMTHKKTLKLKGGMGCGCGN
jgi:hypothetical protein